MPTVPKMDKKTIVIVTLFMAILLIAFTTTRSNQDTCSTHHDEYRVITYRLRDKGYRLLLADTPDKWEYGLMNIKSKKDICDADGMLFQFPVAFPQTFWNKNTLIDLDVYWVNGNKVEGKSYLPVITDNAPTTIHSPTRVRTVIEVIR